MSRLIVVVTLAICIHGCQSGAERLPLKPLAEDATPYPFAELITRTRLQASAATEAFYVNCWADLEDAARGMEQTARFLPKAIEVPSSHKGKLVARADALQKDSERLREAAKTKDVKETNQILQGINLKVRELRLDQ